MACKTKYYAPPPTHIRVGLCGGIDSKISPRGGAFVKMADSEKKVLVCLGKHKRAASFTTPPDGYNAHNAKKVLALFIEP